MKNSDYIQLTVSERKEIKKSLIIFGIITLPVDIFFGCIIYFTILNSNFKQFSFAQFVMSLFMLVIPLFLHAVILVLGLDFINNQKEIIIGKITNKKYRVMEEYTEYKIYLSKNKYSVNKPYYDYCSIGDNIELYRTRFSKLMLGIRKK
jgi:hypothetical protein